MPAPFTDSKAPPHTPRHAFLHRPGCPSSEHEWTMESTDSFFGGAPPSASDRENCYGCRVADYMPARDPPPYFVGEPPTLSRRFFCYGFLFPPLWLLGFLLPLMSRGRDEKRASMRLGEDGKAEVDAEFGEEVRRVETKWAMRCLAALGIFSCVALVVGLVVSWAVR
ncbi:hypothetical protein FPV67DRAFT_1667765 [Lyophyllum atratum]|nr:hypothetical protein FPV67DRAFT_1667765 [Lyophyllum atratum]